MSKIGQKPVVIPSSVKVEMKGSEILIKGSKGELSYTLPDYLAVAIEGDQLLLTRKTDSKIQKAHHGLYRNTIQNAVTGVSDGWTKKLEIVGTGFNVKMQGQSLTFKLGYSHPIIVDPVAGIQLSTEGNTIIVISGYDKHMVGQIAHQIKTIRQPDIYKGKGIRYEGEYIKTKPGKKAKA